MYSKLECIANCIMYSKPKDNGAYDVPFVNGLPKRHLEHFDAFTIGA